MSPEKYRGQNFRRYRRRLTNWLIIRGYTDGHLGNKFNRRWGIGSLYGKFFRVGRSELRREERIELENSIRLEKMKIKLEKLRQNCIKSRKVILLAAEREKRRKAA